MPLYSLCRHRRYGASDVQRLGSDCRARLLAHVALLSRRDRRLRFAASVSAESIEAYVQAIDFQRDVVFGIAARDGSLIGVAHLAVTADVAELGLSVLEQARVRGAGQALFAAAAMHARQRQVRRLLMHCLAENAAMMHIARKAGMHIVINRGDADACLRAC